MKFTYPAIFRPRGDGGYHVEFPDLAGCIAAGDDLEDALDAAIEAELSWIIAELEEDEPDFPRISDSASIPLQEGEFVRQIGVIHHLQEGWSD